MAKEDELVIAGIRLQITGEAEFVKSMQTSQAKSEALKNELKLLEASTTSAGKNGIEYLSAKSQALNSQIDAQREKTKSLKAVLAAAAEEGKADANVTADLEKKILASELATARLTKSLNETNLALAKSENAALKTGQQLKELSEKAEKTGEKLEKVGTKASQFVTLPILAAGAASVKLASDYQESLNKIDVAFGDSGEAVKGWSATSLKSFGLAKGTALDMAATYGDMSTAMGFTNSEAAKMSEQIVGRAADLASFKNISIDVANTSLQAVFTGETESLKKLGVIMTEANLIQYMKAQGDERDYKNLTQKEKVQLRLNYVMEMTNNAAGDFARTSEGTANQSRMFTESLKELGETFGEQILPVITPVIKQGNELLGTFAGLDDGAKKIIIGIALAVAAAGPALTIAGKGIQLYGTLAGMKAAQTLASGAKTTALIAETGATNALTVAETGAATAGAAMATTLTPILAIAAAVAAAGIAYEAISTDSRNATAAVTEMTDAINKGTDAYNKSIGDIDASTKSEKAMTDQLYVLESVEHKSNQQKAEMKSLVAGLNKSVDGLNLVYNESTDSLNANKDAVYDLIDAKTEQLKMAAYESQIQQGYEDQIKLQDAYTAAVERYNKAQAAINGYHFRMPWDSIGEFAEAKSAAEAVIAVTDSYDKTTAALESAKTAYGDMASSASDASGVTSAAMQGTSDAVEAASDDVADSVTIVTDAFQKQLEEARDSQQKFSDDMTSQMQKYYGEMNNIHADGIKKDELTVQEWKANLDAQIKDMEQWRKDMRSLASKVPDDFEQYLAQLGPSQETMIQGLVDATPEELSAYIQTWRDGIEEASAVSATLSESLVSAYGNPYLTWYSLGQNTIDGLIAGMKANSPGAYTAAEEAAKGIATAYKTKQKINSPSKVMEEAGYYTFLPLITEAQKASARLNDLTTGMAGTMAGNLMISPAVSLGSAATSRAITGYTSQIANTTNNSQVDSSVSVNMAGANFYVRKDSDIRDIAEQLALLTARAQKARG